jgi:hypothetical protein
VNYFLCILGVLGWLFGGTVFLSAQTSIHEGIGALIGVGGSVLFGSGAIITAIDDLRESMRPQTVATKEPLNE